MNKFLIAFFLIIIFSSCKTQQKAIVTMPSADSVPTPVTQDNQIIDPSDDLYQKLKENELHFNTLSAKFMATATIKKKETSVSGLIRVKNDSVIWISITPALGIEAARILIVDDTIKILNRLEGTCLVAPFLYVSSLTKQELDLNMLQALLFGNDFSYFDNTSFTTLADEQGYKLTTQNRRKLRRFARKNESATNIPFQCIWLNQNNYKIIQSDLQAVQENNYKLTALYNNFIKIDEQIAPSSVNLQAEAANEKFQLQIDFSKMQINPESLTFPFRIPESYSIIAKEKP